MTGVPITSELVVFLIAVFGAVAGIWWRVEGRIDTAKTRAEQVAAEFASYRTHVAETYITKQGLREQIDQVMGGIADLKSTVEHMNSRIDNFIGKPDSRPPQARRRSNTP